MGRKTVGEPAYPITDAQVEEFQALLKAWRRKLHLMNWRFAMSRTRPVSDLASVKVYPEHRLVRYAVGRDWGSHPPEPDAVERLVVHELLHVRLNQLLDVAFRERDYTEAVQGEEHDVISVLEEVLVGMSLEIAELRRQLAEKRKTHDSSAE